MKLRKRDVEIRTCRGDGPGGQHRNKTDSCVVAMHKPTGVTVRIDGRNQHQNRRVAMRRLRERLEQLEQEQRAAEKKARRDQAIQPQAHIRTYDCSRGVVTDHRTKKRASIKQILVKGLLDLLR